MFRPKLRQFQLKPGQFLKAKVVYPFWTLDEGVIHGFQGRVLLVLQEKKGDTIYSSSEVLLTTFDSNKALELVLYNLQARLQEFMNPAKWSCSNCGIPVPNPEMDKPCPGCHMLFGVEGFDHGGGE